MHLKQYKKIFKYYMNRPNYWIVNPYYIDYKNVPKRITCVECYQGKKTKTHNIQPILYDNAEKKYNFYLKFKKINNNNNNNESETCS